MNKVACYSYIGQLYYFTQLDIEYQYNEYKYDEIQSVENKNITIKQNGSTQQNTQN